MVVNRMRGADLDIPPLRIVAADSKLMPASALLNRGPARYDQRHLSRLRDRRGREEVIERQGTVRNARLRGVATKPYS